MLCQKVGNILYSSFVSLFILCCFSCGFWVIIGGHFHKKPISKKINKKPRCKQPKKKRYYHGERCYNCLFLFNHWLCFLHACFTACVSGDVRLIFFTFSLTSCFVSATEIRCEEKSRGGMCYEMILAEPIAEKPEATAGSPKAPKSVTEQDIKMKLLQAEERRKVSIVRFYFWNNN